MSRAQHALTTMKHYYEGIIDALPNIVYILDKHCTLSGYNHYFRSLLHVEEANDLFGLSPYKKLIHLAHWSKERVELLKRDDINALLSEKPVYDVEEAPVFGLNDDIIYYRSCRIPLVNQAQEVIGLMVVLSDMTEQKRMAEQLERMKTQLQKANARPEATRVAVTSPQEANDNLNPPKVLMVEDNSIAQKAAQSLLMQLECHVDIADSGDKAIALFEAGKYDLIFMDIGLEDTSGYVISKRIRQMEKNTKHHVPIIALTSYKADVVQFDCVDYSMEGALTKPLTIEQAKQILQHYVYHIDIPVSGLKNLKGLS